MTAPTIRAGWTTGFDTSNTTTTIITTPTNSVGDEIFIAVVSDAAGQVFTPPSGFGAAGISPVYSNVDIPATSPTATFALFSLTSSGSEPSTYSVGLGTAERQSWIAFVIQNAGPIDAQGSPNSTGNSSAATVPFLTTTLNDCLVIGIIGTDGVSTPHTPSAMTKLAESSGTSAGSVSVHYQAASTAGTYPSNSAVFLNVSEQWLGVSFAIKPIIEGAAAITLGALTVSATGTLAISGTAAITLGDLTVSATGIVPRTGTAAITLGALTIAASGTGLGTINGTAAITLGALTVSATGVHTAAPISGTAAITLGALTVAATGYLAVDLPAPTLSGSVSKGADLGNTTTTVVLLPTFTNGDTVYIALVSDATSQVFGLPYDGMGSSAGFVALYSNVPIPTASPTATFALFYLKNAQHSRFHFEDPGYSLVVPVTTPERQTWITWAVHRGNAPDEQGTNVTGSSATATIPTVTPFINNSLLFGVVATDGVSTPHTGASNYTQLAEISGTSAGSLSVWSHTIGTAAAYGPDSVTITSEQWLGVSFSVPPTLTGSAEIPLGALTVTATGTSPRTGTADITLGELTVSATGLVPRTGTAAITLGALTITSLLSRTGTAAITLGALTVAATGIVTAHRTGTAAITLGALTVTSAGFVSSGRIGNASITLGALTISASGTVPISSLAAISNISQLGTIFTISVENAVGLKLAGGPIVTGIKWTYKQKLSQAGEWTLEVPLAEPRLQFATLKRRVHCYVRRSGRLVWLGGGIIENRSFGLSGDDVPVMTLSGPDLLRELNGITVNFEVAAMNLNPQFGVAGTPSGSSTAPRTLLIMRGLLEAIPSWHVTFPFNLPEITARFVHESVLNALIGVCEKTGAFFWMEPWTVAPRNIVVATTPVASNIVATNMADPLAAERNPNICLISNIEKTEASWDAYNRLIVYGHGDGEARLTLAAATVWPNGGAVTSTYSFVDPYGRNHSFVLDKTTNTITDILAASEFGQEEKSISFKDIGPVTDNTADFIAAANTLVAAAVNQLILSSFPTNTYRLSVAALRAVVHPGMQIRVIARKVRDGIVYLNIDERLIIQEVDYEIDVNGERVTGLVVATTWKAEKTGATLLSEQIQKLTALEAHPQAGANENTLTYREDVDDDYGAAFPFWLSRGTSRVNSITLRYKLEPLRSSVKTVGGTASGNVAIPSHQHNVSVSDHAHGVPLTGAGSPTGSHPFAQPVYFDVTDSTFYFQAGDGDAEAVTSQDGGAQTVASGGGGNGTFTVDIASAISAVYGVFVDPVAPYTVTDLDWTANGVRITETPVSVGGDWYEVDITRYMTDAATLRPIAYNNTVAVAVKPLNHATKRVRVTTQIELRTTVQTLAIA